MHSFSRRFLMLFSITLMTLLAACDSGSSVTAYGTPPASPPPVHSHVPCAQKTSAPITLTMYYGSEKQQWIDDVVPAFNNSHYVACDGPIVIKAIPIGSGDSMEQILGGQIKPDIWSPAGSVWLTLLNDAWHAKNGKDIIGSGATDALSLVTSPVVIAMWKPLAESLGWPKKALGWSDIAALSANPQGWAAYGHPEYGSFKFGHTHPDTSNSGLDAVIGEYYAAAGKSRSLSTSDISSPQARSYIAQLESSVIHYGDSTGFFATEMFNKGPNFLSAAVMYESLVVESYDAAKYPNAHSNPPVVAIYPKEGTFLSDHPFTIPDAPWMTASKRAAAAVFADYLLAPAQQAKALIYGFRPTDTKSTPLVAPIDSTHGVDPQQPTSLLQIPDAQLIREIKSSWDEQRRKVSVMLVLDKSGSMSDTINGVSKIKAAKDGLKAFISLLSDTDSVGLTVFSDKASILAPIAPLGTNRDALNQAIDGISADGSTRLYDTINEQVQATKLINDSTIKAVVVLTDGIDNASSVSVDQLSQQLAVNGNDAGKGLKVFSIAYGSDANVTGLTKLAEATGGTEYNGTPDNIRRIYLSISRFF